MKVTVSNVRAFRVAQAATSKKDFQKALTGVLVRPDGMVCGTDGFCMAYHAHAVEPFEGEAFIAKLQTALPEKAKNVVIDTDAGVVTYTIRRSGTVERRAMAYEVIDWPFPDFEAIVPQCGQDWSGQEFGFDLKLALKLNAAAGRRSQFVWQFTDKNIIRVVGDGDPDMCIYLAPLRTAGYQMLPAKPSKRRGS